MSTELPAQLAICTTSESKSKPFVLLEVWGGASIEDSPVALGRKVVTVGEGSAPRRQGKGPHRPQEEIHGVEAMLAMPIWK